MGLDQYAYKIKKNLIADEIDIKLYNEKDELVVPEKSVEAQGSLIACVLNFLKQTLTIWRKLS